MGKEEKYDFVIIGGGPATRNLNRYLRTLNPDASVAVIRKEERIANHCSIPYIIDGSVPLEGGGLVSDARITNYGSRLIKERVVSGDPESKYVVTDAGNRFNYDKLIFAVGSQEVVPPVSGIDLPGVLKMRFIDDLRASLRVIDEKRSFVVLGAGYVGLEIGAALRRIGRDVTIVEMLPHVMGDRYDPEFTSRIEEVVEREGVRLELGKKAVRIGGRDWVEFVELENGDKVETEAVLLAAGVAPRLDFARKFGLETARDGIIVDEFFHTNLPDVYAIGDCIQTRSYTTGEPFPGKLGSNAAKMARTLGMNFGGYEFAFEGVINPACTSVFGMQFCSAGLTEKDAVQQGIKVRTSKTENTDIYDNMPQRKTVWVKLIFRESDRQVIGGELLGPTNFAGVSDCLGQLIYRKATVEDIVRMDFSTHPELTPNPAHAHLMFAAQKAFEEWQTRKHD